MQHLSRRTLIKFGLLAGSAVPLGMAAVQSALAQSAALDPADPSAKALGFVVASTNPAQNCGNCAQYKGAAGSAKGGCTLFPGKDVPAAGYCKAWVKKPG